MALQRDSGSLEPASSGTMAADVSNAVVRLVREHFGKGPMQAKTILHEDVVVTILRGGFTQAEQTLYKAGKGELVDEMRRTMQDVFEREMRSEVERLTGRRVEAFLSANHHEPDVTVEMFLLMPRRNGTGDGEPAPVEVDERAA
jgi:uncharacterized protein YbcI